MTTDGAAFKGGFSFRDNVVGKPPSESLRGLMLGDQWVWAPDATPEQLLVAVAVKGYAVTPAKWADGYKSKKKGRFIESSYLMLDFDDNLTWEQCKKHPYFVKHACFAYTSASHGKPGKGDRFRVVFALDVRVTDHVVFDRLIEGLHGIVPGSDTAINAASLLYGNPEAETHVFGWDNRLPTQDVYFHWAMADAQRKLKRQSYADAVRFGAQLQDSSFSRVQFWLDHIPNSARSTWVRIAGCLRNIEGHGYDWAYELFEEWSAKDYSDFDPEACERLWESLDSNPGGFRKLKDYYIYFKENPEEDEYTLGTPSSHRQIQKRIDTLNNVGESKDGNAYEL